MPYTECAYEENLLTGSFKLRKQSIYFSFLNKILPKVQRNSFIIPVILIKKNLCPKVDSNKNSFTNILIYYIEISDFKLKKTYNLIELIGAFGEMKDRLSHATTLIYIKT